MSNKKKTENIDLTENISSIDLSGGEDRKTEKHYLPNLKKKESASEIKDIYSEYTKPFRGKSFRQKRETKGYKLISNFLRILVLGLVILLIINGINIYVRGNKTLSLVKDKAFEGYGLLMQGSKSTTKVEFQTAKAEFEKAYDSFNEAKKELWFLLEDETVYAKKSSVGIQAKSILNSGKYFAEAGEYFSDALEELNKIPVYFIAKNQTGQDSMEQVQLPEENITDILKRGTDKASKALVSITAARDELKMIDQNILPEDTRGKLIFVQDKIDAIIESLNAVEKSFPAILKLLGAETPHRYLILLQNNAEIRPAGGFIGSYILLEIDKGIIKNMTVNDVYHLDDKFNGFIEPPEFLLPIMSNIEFRDSNYSPDFLFAGKKAAYMLEKEGGPVVDTVIAINQNQLKDFLEITGPLQVGQMQNKITADNYLPVLTYVIESKIWGKEDPKHILKVMVPEFKEEIMKTSNASKIMSVIYKAIQEKMILAYSKDAMIEALFDEFGMSGRVKKTEEKEDYLNVVNYSIGGNKTEPFIEEKITHQTTIQKDGSLVDEVTVVRTHLFDKSAQAKWNGIWESFGFDYKNIPGYIVDILGRGTNKMITRVFVPEKSSLIEVIGAKQEDVKIGFDSELGKTYFAFNISVAPGNSSSITIKYKLPFKLDISPIDTYLLTAQKQPGSAGSILTKTIKFQDGIDDIKPYDFYPDSGRISDENKIIFATNLAYDRNFSVVLGQD